MALVLGLSTHLSHFMSQATGCRKIPTTDSSALKRFVPQSARNYAVLLGHSHIDALKAVLVDR